MIILTDCDGVLADFVGPLCETLTRFGYPKKPTDIRTWELTSSLDEEEFRCAHDAIMQPGFCSRLDWYPGARDFFDKLKQRGTVHVLTAPYDASETWMRERKAWFSGALPRDQVHFITGTHKHIVRGDVLIEDHPKTAFAWLNANPEGYAILIDRPWNQASSKDWRGHQRLYRAPNYVEALRAIDEWFGGMAA